MLKKILVLCLLLLSWQFAVADEAADIAAAQLAVQNILAENPDADATTIAAAIQATGLSAEIAVTAMVAAGIDATSAINAVAPLFSVDPTILVAASINVPLRIATGTETSNENNTRPPPAGGTPLLTSQLIVIFQELNSPS